MVDALNKLSGNTFNVRVFKSTGNTAGQPTGNTPGQPGASNSDDNIKYTQEQLEMLQEHLRMQSLTPEQVAQEIIANKTKNDDANTKSGYDAWGKGWGEHSRKTNKKLDELLAKFNLFYLPESTTPVHAVTNQFIENYPGNANEVYTSMYSNWKPFLEYVASEESGATQTKEGKKQKKNLNYFTSPLFMGLSKKQSQSAMDKVLELNPTELKELVARANKNLPGQELNITATDIKFLKSYKEYCKLNDVNPAEALHKLSQRHSGVKSTASTLGTWVFAPLLGEKLIDKGIENIQEGNTAGLGAWLGFGNLLSRLQAFDIGRGALLSAGNYQTPWMPHLKIATILSHAVEPLVTSASLMYDPTSSEMFTGSDMQTKPKDILSKSLGLISSGLQYLMPASLGLFSWRHIQDYKKEKAALKATKAKPNKHQKYSLKYNFVMGPLQMAGMFTWFTSLIVDKFAGNIVEKKKAKLEEEYQVQAQYKALMARQEELTQKLISIVQTKVSEIQSDALRSNKTLSQDEVMNEAREFALGEMKDEVEQFEEDMKALAALAQQVDTLEHQQTKRLKNIQWFMNILTSIGMVGIDANMFLGKVLDPHQGLMGLTTQKMAKSNMKFGKALKHVWKNEPRFNNKLSKGITLLQTGLFPLVGIKYISMLTEEGSPFAIDPADESKAGMFRRALNGLTHSKAVQLYSEYGWLAGMVG